MRGEEEDAGKGCFWIFMGIGGCIFLACLGQTILELVR